MLLLNGVIEGGQLGVKYLLHVVVFEQLKQFAFAHLQTPSENNY